MPDNDGSALKYPPNPPNYDNAPANAPDFIRNLDGHVPGKLGREGANVYTPGEGVNTGDSTSGSTNK